jgi:hypothetical protein
VVIPEPIPTSKDMDSEYLRLRVEEALKAATKRADELCGLPPDTALASDAKTAPSSPASALEPANDKEPVMEHRGT